MDKQTIKNQLYEKHNSFISYLGTLSEEDFLKSKNDKWTAGQQFEHIFLGVKPVRQILSLPKFLLQLIWGQANRESKSYEDLVEKYFKKIVHKAVNRFSSHLNTFFIRPIRKSNFKIIQNNVSSESQNIKPQNS